MTSPSTDRLYGSNSSLAMKAPVVAGTTANITLEGAQTIDGVAVVSENRVLVKNQTDQTENGIYIASTSEWQRAPDFDGDRDIVKGTLVRVSGGTTLADSYWAVSTANPITIDTSNITFTQSNNSLAGVTAFGATLIAAASAAAARTVLGLGTAALSAATDFLPITGGTLTGDLKFTDASFDIGKAGATRPRDLFISRAAVIGTDLSAATISGAIVATQAQQEAGSVTTAAVTPGRQQFHPSAAKAWVYADYATNIAASYNTTSVTDTGTGDETANWTTAFSGTSYCAVASCENTAALFTLIRTLATGSTRVLTFNTGAAAADATKFSCVAFGDQ